MTIAKTAGFTPAAGESSPHAGAKRAGVSPGLRRRITATRGPVVRAWGDKLAAGAVGLVLCGFIPATASAAPSAPCAKHVGEKRVACLTAHKAQAKRDAAHWPKYPVTTRDLAARDVAVHRWVRLGRCEAGHGPGYGGVRWNTPSGWRWQGGLGMYDRSHASTGHPYGYDAGQWNWHTQVLVGERLRLKYGISAWSAAGCWR